jgi:hypothetical protein
MKYKAKMWFFAMGVALVTLAAIPPAEARSTTGWNSFKVWSPLGADQCVAESFGAAVNRCNFNINLTFELVVDTAGLKHITIWDAPDGYGAFTCGVVGFSGINNDIHASYGQTFNPEGQQKLDFWFNVNPGDGVSVYCFNVPPSRGVANINWTPA